MLRHHISSCALDLAQIVINWSGANPETVMPRRSSIRGSVGCDRECSVRGSICRNNPGP